MLQHQLRLGGQGLRNLQQSAVFLIHIEERTPSAQKFHTTAALVLFVTQHLHAAQHTRKGRMGAAAGADICIFHADNAQRSGELFVELTHFVLQLHSLSAIHIIHMHRAVLPNNLVGEKLRLQQILLGQLLIQINKHAVLIHMKAHIVRFKKLPASKGKNVLAQMLLHSVQAHVPVQHCLHRNAHGQRLLAFVVNMTILFGHMLYHDTINFAPVTKLATTLRKEDCLVQFHKIFAIPLGAGRDHGLAFLEHGVVFKKLCRHKKSPSSHN